jgi:glycosyltransferase involved in cell wall biosynthesis
MELPLSSTSGHCPLTAPSPHAVPVPSPALPLVSILLIAYKQEHFVADAVRSALAQTYAPLEILISDDCSPDATHRVMLETVAAYQGPHRPQVFRTERNLGISAHVSKLARQSRGELLFVFAGDDISMPTRCERVVQEWLAQDRLPDLISSDMVDMDQFGALHGRIVLHSLEQFRCFDDWLTGNVRVTGASHAWSRRLFDRFGDMRPGIMAEDQIMAFRAIVSGGAINLREPLVQYRRGGLSGKRRWNSVGEFVARMRLTTFYLLNELEQLIADARTIGREAEMRDVLAPQLARERYRMAVFGGQGFLNKLSIALKASRVRPGQRIRFFLYAACPAVYTPFFLLGRLVPFRRR